MAIRRVGGREADMRIGDYDEGHRVICEQGLQMNGVNDHPVKVVIVDIIGGSILGAVSAMFAGPFGPLIAMKLTGLRLWGMGEIGCPEVSALGHEAISGDAGFQKSAVKRSGTVWFARKAT